MSLYLNMVYYNIQLSEDESNLCIIVLRWVKYHYKPLTMKVSNSPDIFQQKMSKLFQCFDLIFVNIY